MNRIFVLFFLLFSKIRFLEDHEQLCFDWDLPLSTPKEQLFENFLQCAGESAGTKDFVEHLVVP